MQIELTRKFKKQVEVCNDRRIRLKVVNIIEAAAAADTMQGFNNLKKLSGYTDKYRIRVGNYRIGLVIEEQTVIFAAFDHRSDIYKYFP